MNASIVQWVQHWGYPAVFLGVMLESTGVPVPGETFVIIASVLAAKHALAPLDVCLAAVAGAVIGDNLGYVVGRLGGRTLVLRLSAFWRVPATELERAERWFERYGAATVFFGRFVAILRMFSGPLAGLSRMPWLKFLLFNALGGLAWAGMVVGLSLVLGRVLVAYLHRADTLLLILALLGIIGFFVGMAWRRHRS